MEELIEEAHLLSCDDPSPGYQVVPMADVEELIRKAFKEGYKQARIAQTALDWFEWT
jgi:hypothetical protein